MEKVDLNKREKEGKIASIIGIVINVVLSALKITVGLVFGVISVLADGINNLSDCGSSLISLISFKFSSKPADKEHPFGHERIEYISAMAVAFLILIIAFELVTEAVTFIINPVALNFSAIIVIVLAVSVAVKFLMAVYYKKVSKKINSSVLRATAIDSMADGISTTAVLIALIISKTTGVALDGYVGVLVALFVGFSGVRVLRETMSHLVGQAPDKQVVDEIKKRVLDHEGVLGVHDLAVYSYGPNKYFASVHVEVDAKLDVMLSHELVDDIEQEFLKETNVILTGHLDPIVTDDEEVVFLREQIKSSVRELDERFSAHDIRTVKGPNRVNVIFDVAVPFDTKISQEDIKQQLTERILQLSAKYNPVITVEKQI